MPQISEAIRRGLRAAVGRIIPRDRDPGGCDLGADAYVEARLAGETAADAPAIVAGLRALGPHFPDMPPAGQDESLSQIEAQPWFKRLVELAQEGFYADPGNDGNRAARSWAMIGYNPRLPRPPRQ